MCMCPHSGVVEDDIAAGHVAMENMFLEVLYQCTLRGHEQTEKWSYLFVIEVGLLLSNQKLKQER